MPMTVMGVFYTMNERGTIDPSSRVGWSLQHCFDTQEHVATPHTGFAHAINLHKALSRPSFCVLCLQGINKQHEHKPSVQDEAPGDRAGGSKQAMEREQRLMKQVKDPEEGFRMWKQPQQRPGSSLFSIKTKRDGVQRSRVKSGDEKTAEKAAIEILVHGGENIASVLQRLLESVGNCPSVWDQIIKQMESRGARRRALEIFHFLQRQDAFRMLEQNYVTIIGILGRDGKVGLAQEIFSSMREKEMVPTVFSYTMLMNVYAKNGLLKEAWEVFETMQKEGCSPTVVTYNGLIHACANQGKRVKDALELFDLMKSKGNSGSEVTYNSLVNACLSEGCVDQAYAIFQEMRKENHLPNVVTYTNLINAYGKAGDLRTAMSIFKEMKDKGRVPNVWTYNSLLKAHAKQGFLKEAWGLYKEMECAGCLPDLYTYNIVLDMYGKGGLFDELDNIFQEMLISRVVPDQDQFQLDELAYSNRLETRSGLGSLLDSPAKQQSVAVSMQQVTYNTLLDAYSKRGQSGKALDILEKMKEAGCRPDVWTYNILLTSTEAEKTWQEMRSAGCLPNISTYCGMIDCYAHHGMYEEALSIFRKMMKAGLEPDTQIYTALMDAYANAGECDEVEKLLFEMQSIGLVPDGVTYGILVRAFAKADRLNEGLTYYKYVLQHVETDCRMCKPLIVEYYEAYEVFISQMEGERIL
ncbi:hypothetical protein O6H91_02G006500 [Diphasiastrum complanatum]|uniref:Uncharacterized protein n=1 Tax=Diphasiastrum complanatum TaxID=34168 RepID=A0ACC2ECW0_DIPCM|nr:hypothetical protein O6H91_02G006500 [Diphasiastrum complanatum]